MTLQQQAEYLIKKFNLKKELAKFGEVHLVGSVAMKTMLKTDIDYQIYPKGKPTIKLAREVEKLYKSKGLTVVKILKLYDIKKILVSTAFIFKGNRWTIDVTFASRIYDAERDSYKLLKEFQKKLTDLKRKRAIKLKKIFKEKDLLRKGMSYYIYRAVIDEEAKNEKDVLSYLEKNKISMKEFKADKKKIKKIKLPIIQ